LIVNIPRKSKPDKIVGRYRNLILWIHLLTFQAAKIVTFISFPKDNCSDSRTKCFHSFMENGSYTSSTYINASFPDMGALALCCNPHCRTGDDWVSTSLLVETVLTRIKAVLWEKDLFRKPEDLFSHTHTHTHTHTYVPISGISTY
jgi:hypothetical protein